MSGERIRTFNLMRQLAARGWRLSLFALAFGPPPAPGDLVRLEELCDDVLLEPFRPRPLARYGRVLKNVLTARPFQTEFFFDEAASAALERRLETSEHDLVIVGQLYMTPYLKADRRANAILDAHNVELRRLESIAAAVPFSPRGLAARLQCGPVRRLEAEVARSFARTLAVSPAERDYFEALAPGTVDLVPNGVDCASFSPRAATPTTSTLLFLGSMDYSANVDAVGFLAREVLPHVRRRDARVTVIGSNPRPSALRAARRAPLPVELLGFVGSTRPYFEAARAFVVPLRFGGGTRLKILEALAYGVPVVTTSVGCEGLELEHERDVLVADHPRDFAGWIDRLLEDDELCARLGANGRRTVERHYDWKAIGDRLDAALGKALERR